MITENEAVVGTKVYFHDNKANIVNTEISSPAFKDQFQNTVVRCHGEKAPVKIDYLNLGHKTAAQVTKAISEIKEADELRNRVNNSDLSSAVQQAPIIVFKGKLAGETQETEITPTLIAQKAKPLLELKINGLFDTDGAEKVKDPILKPVRMRTLVEKQAEPAIKAINAKAKEHVARIKAIADPIYAE